MVGEYVISSAHNFSFTLEFVIYFCPSYFVAQKASVPPRVSTTKHVIQTVGLASSSSPITKARGARAVMPQFFHPFNTEEGGRDITPQAIRASNSHVPGVHVH
jgi:hypothetical protein